MEIYYRGLINYNYAGCYVAVSYIQQYFYMYSWLTYQEKADCMFKVASIQVPHTLHSQIATYPRNCYEVATSHTISQNLSYVAFTGWLYMNVWPQHHI